MSSCRVRGIVFELQSIMFIYRLNEANIRIEQLERDALKLVRDRDALDKKYEV